MSETPTEEYQLDLSTEIEQFQEWLKNNKNGTYKEYLKDKTALLTEEQKKDPKIIDLEPYLPPQCKGQLEFSYSRSMVN